MASWKRSPSSTFTDVRRPVRATTCAGIFRHQITVSSAGTGACLLDEALERRPELAVARAPALEGEAEVVGGLTRPLVQGGVVGLREVDEPPVVAEHLREELRVEIELEAADDKGL